jgi:hypothetical protein
MRHGAAEVAIHFLLADRVALVVVLLAAATPISTFAAAVLEIDRQRDQRRALLRRSFSSLWISRRWASSRRGRVGSWL